MVRLIQKAVGINWVLWIADRLALNCDPDFDGITPSHPYYHASSSANSVTESVTPKSSLAWLIPWKDFGAAQWYNPD